MVSIILIISAYGNFMGIGGFQAIFCYNSSAVRRGDKYVRSIYILTINGYYNYKIQGEFYDESFYQRKSFYGQGNFYSRRSFY